jgi:hypothetical protein
MKCENEKTLTLAKNEEEFISKFINTLEDVFELNFEESPEDLAEIMYAISSKSPKAYLLNDKGAIKIEYQKSYIF